MCIRDRYGLTHAPASVYSVRRETEGARQRKREREGEQEEKVRERESLIEWGRGEKRER